MRHCEVGTAQRFLDHVVLDTVKCDHDYDILVRIAQDHDVDAAVKCLHRFIGRCTTSREFEMVSTMMNHLLTAHPSGAIRDIAVLYGGVLQHDPLYLHDACACGMHDIIKQCIADGQMVDNRCIQFTIDSCDSESIRMVLIERDIMTCTIYTTPPSTR